MLSKKGGCLADGEATRLRIGIVETPVSTDDGNNQIVLSASLCRGEADGATGVEVTVVATSRAGEEIPHSG